MVGENSACEQVTAPNSNQTALVTNTGLQRIRFCSLFCLQAFLVTNSGNYHRRVLPLQEFTQKLYDHHRSQSAGRCFILERLGSKKSHPHPVFPELKQAVLLPLTSSTLLSECQHKRCVSKLKGNLGNECLSLLYHLGRREAK